MTIAKSFACMSCGAVEEQVKRGRPRLRCERCRAEYVRARHAGTLIRRCPTCGNTPAPARTYCSDACIPARPWSERKAGRSVAQCEACGHEYPKYSKGQRWCSRACSNQHKVKSGGPRRFTPEEAKERIRLSSQAKCRRRRAAKRGGVSEPYTLAQIAERDRSRCGLCGGRVAMKQRVPHPKAPTIDHVVPVFEGGDDTRANVQLAHFRCNSAKGARGCQQLALIG